MKSKKSLEFENKSDVAKTNTRKPYRPFDDCLLRAIADESNPLEGMTPAKERLFMTIAGMIEGQANAAFKRYYDAVDIKFERLNRETERLAFLEQQRFVFQQKEEIEFFDTELYPMRREGEPSEKLAMAVGMNVKPTPELLTIWQNCDRKAAKFIREIPYLNQMLQGLIEAKKLEFVEDEIRERQHLVPVTERGQDIAPTVFWPPKEPAITEKKVQKDLPTLEEAVKNLESLPELWKRLSKFKKPFVSEGGKFIRQVKKNAAVLTALADALKAKGKIKDHISTHDAYQILCTFFEVEPASRPDKSKDTHRYRDVYEDLMESI